MRVLLVNDDGIHAPGLRAMYDALAEQHDVLVVAPHVERSAGSHAVTFRGCVRVAKVDGFGVNAYMCEGTPCDCTRIGLILAGGFDESGLRAVGVDAVVSGINNGANLSLDTHYSGTVSAAMEAVFHGVPALAVSIDGREPVDAPGAAASAVRILEDMAGRFPAGIMLNLNFPNLPVEEFAGWKAAPLGYNRRVLDYALERSSPDERVYTTADYTFHGLNPDTDQALIEQGYAVITPIGWDFTARAHMADADALVLRAGKSALRP